MQEIKMLPVSKQSRLGFIDAIRGIAACLVMMQHALYHSGLLGDYPNGNLTGFIPTYLELGEAGVVSFFLVSGFVIPLSIEKTATIRLFWLHRILRIYPLYLFIYIASVLLQWGDSLDSFRALATNFMAHLFMIQEYLKQENFVFGSWTLSLEMIWYFGLSILLLTKLNKKTNLLVGTAVAVSIGASLVCAHGTHLPMGRLSLLVDCVLGLVCYRREKGEISVRHFGMLATVLAATIIMNLSIGFLFFPSLVPTASFTMVRDSWALAAAVFFIPFLCRQASIWNHSILAFLGRISYSLYLVHGMILLILGHTPLKGVPFVLATVALALPLSYITYRLIEAPPIKYGHQIQSRFVKK